MDEMSTESGRCYKLLVLLYLSGLLILLCLSLPILTSASPSTVSVEPSTHSPSDQNTTISNLQSERPNATNAGKIENEAEAVSAGMTLSASAPTTSPDVCNNTCQQGPNIGQCPDSVGGCDCGADDYFHGDYCEVINLSVTNQTSSSRTVNVTWPSPPAIQGAHYFTYHKLDNPADLHDVDIDMKAEDTWALLYGLQSGHTNYTICILRAELKDLLYTWNASERAQRTDPAVHPDCFDIVTMATRQLIGPEHELAFQVVTGLLLATLTLTFVAKVVEWVYQSKKRATKVRKTSRRDSRERVEMVTMEQEVTAAKTRAESMESVEA